MTISRDVIQRLLNVVNDTRRRLNTVESREYVLLTAAQTLTNKTLTTPTIGNFTNATHDHEDAAGGGQLSLTAAVTGILPPANGGTGVNNDTRTLTINTNSGTLAFGAASKTLTINESLNLSGASGQTLTLTNSLTVQGGGNTVLSSSGNFTLTIPATGTAALLATSNVFTATQSIVVDQGNAEVQAITYRDTPSAGFFRANKARGTLASPTVVQNGDLIGGFIGNAYTGSAFSASAQVSLFADGPMGTNRLPGRIDLMTSDGTGNPAVRMVIKESGNVGIGETSPTAQLQVEQSSAGGAKPTLRLQQADLSEEFVRFDTTVGTGNPINTTALGAYYGRVRVWVEGVGAKWIALYD